MKKVTAVFDIGKTNKKFFLFDSTHKVVYSDNKTFKETTDEDGWPCDDLPAIRQWAIALFDKVSKSNKYNIQALNFSTYGASLVHLDKDGNHLTPLYNYTKSIDRSYIDKLYMDHGGLKNLSRDTASPPSGMLNSGVQLYWLKYHRPKIYAKIKYSLHLPQYMSFLFSGVPVSDYTSIGCHTLLWDYKKSTYHDWVIKEGLDEKLAPIVDTGMSYNLKYNGNKIKIGVGIHDSSAAVLPYLLGDKSPFLLISTGTWCVTLNPFSTNSPKEESDVDYLNYMNIHGKGIEAARIYLGNEYKLQVEKLNKKYSKNTDFHKSITFSAELYKSIVQSYSRRFHFDSLDTNTVQPIQNDYSGFNSFEHAYHQLMYELIEVQIASSIFAMGDTVIKKIYIDGGFVDNDIFVKLLSYHFSDYKIRTANNPHGSALGAALVMKQIDVDKALLKTHYGLKKHKPIILDN